MTEPGGPWPLAGLIGGRIAGSHPLASSYHGEVLADQLPGLIAEVEPLVAAETRLVGPEAPGAAVIDRREWVERNLGFLQHVMDRYEAVAGEQPARATALSALESGSLLGVLAKRVLGQYELVLPTGDQADTIYLVGDNILQMERQHQFNPRDFRTWIVLHECTHRAQFVGVPWLRDYFLSLIDDIVGASAHDPQRVERILRRVVDAVRGEEPFIDERGLFGVVASDAQRAQVDRVQALMSLLEGHGHVVMDRIGERILPTQSRMSAILKQRRTDPKMALFMRLTGMEMKMRQYAEGEAFVLGVKEAAGWEALDAAWDSPDTLPTLAEIAAPGKWLSRVA